MSFYKIFKSEKHGDIIAINNLDEVQLKARILGFGIATISLSDEKDDDCESLFESLTLEKCSEAFDMALCQLKLEGC